MFIFVNTLLESQISPRICLLTSNSSVKTQCFSVENRRLFFYPISEDYSLFQIKMGLKVFNFICENGHTFEAMVPSIEAFEEQKKNGFSHVLCVIRMSFREPFLRPTSRPLLHKRTSRKIPWRQCIPSIKRLKRYWMRANLSGIDLPMRLAPFTEETPRTASSPELRPRKRFQNSGMKELKF